ncbi:hypothetical protein PR202_gb14204 [Eleusine coracana subsp. coracana]|uniref:Uncharacterized protein n=1 Tax=Eleusine coracana subsp. coracana TaxID=191504 RepID=A0AAV5EU24_ELECO|nr:hypothetical protein PR202_gb14204 [Eleusine coracana subsp. coracana]
MLVHLADTVDVAISCFVSDDGGKFVVTESGADARRLALDEEHDVYTFERLVPKVYMTVLPASVLVVQATRLEGGSMPIGVTVHHGVADGRSLWRFMEAWVASCHGDTPPALPTFDRLLVRPTSVEELDQSIM